LLTKQEYRRYDKKLACNRANAPGQTDSLQCWPCSAVCLSETMMTDGSTTTMHQLYSAECDVTERTENVGNQPTHIWP